MNMTAPGKYGKGNGWLHESAAIVLEKKLAFAVLYDKIATYLGTKYVPETMVWTIE